MPVPFSRVCQCETAKTRAEDGRGIFWCRHCDRGCRRSHCPSCKRYSANAVQGSTS